MPQCDLCWFQLNREDWCVLGRGLPSATWAARSLLFSGAFAVVLGHRRSELERLLDMAKLGPSAFSCGCAKPGFGLREKIWWL